MPYCTKKNHIWLQRIWAITDRNSRSLDFRWIEGLLFFWAARAGGTFSPKDHWRYGLKSQRLNRAFADGQFMGRLCKSSIISPSFHRPLMWKDESRQIIFHHWYFLCKPSRPNSASWSKFEKLPECAKENGHEIVTWVSGSLCLDKFRWY